VVGEAEHGCSRFGDVDLEVGVGVTPQLRHELIGGNCLLTLSEPLGNSPALERYEATRRSRK
jgi:hypothetical protein